MDLSPSNDRYLYGVPSGQNTHLEAQFVSGTGFNNRTVENTIYYDALTSITAPNANPHHSETVCDLEHSGLMRQLLQRRVFPTEATPHSDANADADADTTDLNTRVPDEIDPESALTPRNIRALQMSRVTTVLQKTPETTFEAPPPRKEFKLVSAMRKQSTDPEEKTDIGKKQVTFAKTFGQIPVTDMAFFPREHRLSCETSEYFNQLSNLVRSMENPIHDNEITRRAIDRLFEWRESAQDIYDKIVRLGSPPYLSQSEYNRLYDEVYRYDFPRLRNELEEALVRYSNPKPVDELLHHNRVACLKALPYVEKGLVDRAHLAESYNLLMAELTVRCFLVKKNFNQKPDITGQHDSSTDLHKLRYNDETTLLLKDEDGKPKHLKRKRDWPNTDYLVQTLAAITGPYRRAMEVELESTHRFCECLQIVQDPETMLALKIRLHKENQDPSLIQHWENHMREVMLAQLAAVAVKHVDTAVSARMHKKFGDKHPNATDEPGFELMHLFNTPLNADKETLKRIKEESNTLFDQMSSQWIMKNCVNPQLRELHNHGMKIPREWGGRLEDVLKPYLPTWQQLNRYLQENDQLPLR